MKKLLLSFTFVLCSIFSFSQQEPNIESYYDLYDKIMGDENDPETEQAEGGLKKKMERINRIWGDRLYPHGDPSISAKAYYDYAFDFSNNTNEYSDIPWTTVSPIDNNQGNIWAGRMNRITFSPNYDGVTNRTMYACSSHGGLWKSIDAGLNWSTTAADSQLPFTTIADVGISHQDEDRLIVATGFADNDIPQQLYNNVQFFNTQWTFGVYRSFDGGENWEAINLGFLATNSPNFSCRRIVVDPNDEDRVYVATSRGLYRSVNAFSGSPSWDLIEDNEFIDSNVVPEEFDPEINFRGIEFKPDDSETVYFSGADIYRHNFETGDYQRLLSEDFGFNKQEFEDENGEIAQINITTCLVRPEYLYAHVVTLRDGAYALDSGDPVDFMPGIIEQSNILFFNGSVWFTLHTQNGWSGSSQNINTPNEDESPDGMHLSSTTWCPIAVHPFNPDRIVFGYTNVEGTVDLDPAEFIIDTEPESLQFERKAFYFFTPGRYSDSRDLVFEPLENQFGLFEASDGGVSYKSSFASLYDWEKRSKGLVLQTIWSYDDSDYNDQIISQGQHDNGTYFTNPLYNNGNWTKIGHGDGYGTRMDDRFGKVWYFQNYDCYQKNYSNSGDELITNILRGLEITNELPFDNGFDDRKAQPEWTFEIHEDKEGRPIFGFSELHRQLNDPLIHETDPNIPSVQWSEPLSDLTQTEAWKGNRQITEFAIAESDPNYVYVLTKQTFLHSDDIQNSLRPHFFISHTGFGNSVADGGQTVFEDYIQYLPDYVINGEVQLQDFGNGPEPTKPLITDVVVSPSHPKKVWITFTGYGDGQQVWSTVDPYNPDGEPDLQVWYNFDPDQTLHNLPCNGIVYQDGTKDRLFIATDAGVWVKEDKFTTEWKKYGEMPGVRVMEIKLNPCSNKIRAATFGRGVLEAAVTPGTHITSNWEISEDTDFNEDNYSTKNILIKSGATLTVHADLYMPANGYIKVEPGAKLVVNQDAKITNLCGALWGGIEVQGSDNLPQEEQYQGYCILRNCLIENAHTGVWLRKNDENCQAIEGSGGGVVQAEGVDFLNCYIGTEFYPYRRFSQGNPVPNKSSFEDCEFSTNRTLNGGFDMKTGIHLFEVNNVRITSCDFRNDIPSNHVLDGVGAPFGTGIESSNATFILNSSCNVIVGQGEACPTEQLDRSVFWNLGIGIEAFHADDVNTFTARHADFEQCAYGIKAQKVRSAEIDNCRFNVNPVYYSELEIPAYGVHLIKSSKYIVENNEFYSDSGTDHPRIGVVISSSNAANDLQGTEDDQNEIYRNHFHDLTCGTIAQGSNASGQGLADYGLELLCGKYERNDFSIAVTNSGRIESQQGNNSGDGDYAASNFFLQQDQSLGTLTVNDNSLGYVYLHINALDQTPSNSLTSPEVIPSIIELDEQFEEYTDLCPVHERVEDLSLVKSKYNSEKEKAETIETQMDEVVDGGDTGYYLSRSENSTLSSYEIRSEIYPLSPYLSNELLIALIDRENLTPWHLTELLVANSPLDIEVLDFYYDNGVLDEFYHNLIMLYQVGESSHTTLKLLKKQAVSEKQKAQSKYLKLIINDLEEAHLIEHMMDELFTSQGAASEQRIKFRIAIDKGQFASAQTILDLYSITFENADFPVVGQIILDRALNGNDFSAFEGSELNLLTQLAESNGDISFSAQSLLAIYNGLRFDEVIELPHLGTKSAKRKDSEPSGIDFFTIYPNPAKDYLYFASDLPHADLEIVAVIFDGAGREVLHQVVNRTDRLDVSSFSSGMYTLQITVDNIKIQSKTFIIVD